MLDGVKHIILVLSGKGGVGKSMISVQLSLLLKEKGFKVGLLDVDLCGPSVPYLLQLEDKEVHQSPEGWIPVYTDNEQKFAVMSIGFLLKNRNNSVVWRGPKKTGMIKQFLTDVYWQDIDFLIIDTPPGTSDEHISVMENLKTIKCDGAVLVTTPQSIAVEDVQKELTFCRKTGIPIIGIVENMSGYLCPNCSECTYIYSVDGGKALAESAQVPFLGKLPIDTLIGTVSKNQQSLAASFPDSTFKENFNNIVENILSQISSVSN